MPGDVETLIAGAQAAAMAGRWAAARDAWAAAVEEAGPPAELGLAEALMWTGDPAGAVDHARRAYTAFRRASDHMGAGEAAILLYFLHRESLGNVAAACGWMARLERLVTEHGLTPLRGWALLIRAHDRGGRGDALGGVALAEEAFEAARAGGDPDLELCALAARGALLVQTGRLEQGLALLDEAMAASLAGEGTRPDTVVFASCCTIVSCSRAAQFARAAQWIRTSEAIAERIGSFHVHTTCRLHLGCVLVGTGRWDEAEAELAEAMRLARTAEPPLFAEALARLAELRLAQGRIDEAAGLLEGVEDHATSVPARAGVLLARGDPAAAAAVLRRRLRAVGDGCLEAAVLVELLAEAEVARDGPASAARRARALARLAADLGCDVVAARAERALGLVATAAGRPAAVTHLERALEAFCGLEMPLEAGRTHLLLAEALAPHAPDEAVGEARAALAAFDDLGAARLADAARARLRALGVRAGQSGPRSLALLTRRELDVLRLLADGMSNADIAARLYLTRKTVEHHVHNVLVKLDLQNRAEAAAYAVRQRDADRAANSGFSSMRRARGRGDRQGAPFHTALEETMAETTLTDALTVQRAMLAAAQRGDMRALRDTFHPDYAYTASDGVEQPGADAGVAVAELYTTAFPDVVLQEVRSWSPSPDVAIMEFRVTGTHTGPLGDIPPTGRRVTGLVCNIVEVRDGLIWREHEFFDELSLLRQLGLAPEAPVATA